MVIPPLHYWLTSNFYVQPQGYNPGKIQYLIGSRTAYKVDLDNNQWTKRFHFASYTSFTYKRAFCSNESNTPLIWDKGNCIKVKCKQTGQEITYFYIRGSNASLGIILPKQIVKIFPSNRTPELPLTATVFDVNQYPDVLAAIRNDYFQNHSSDNAKTLIISHHAANFREQIKQFTLKF